MEALFFLLASIALLVWLVQELYKVFMARPLSMLQLIVAAVLILGVFIGVTHGFFAVLVP